jgi:AcrR family transcriptional regulator
VTTLDTDEGQAPRATRVRDAAASKEALVEAARELFGQKGFDRTTTREIGEKAGIDAALIARYFGNKAELYIAAVVAEGREAGLPEAYETVEQIADTLFSRTDEHGPGPVMQALIRSDTTAEIKDAARAHMARRLVAPLVAGMEREGADRPEVRAEATVAALLGISLGRSLGWFDSLRSIPQAELVDLVAKALDPLAGDGHVPEPDGTGPVS